MTARTHIVFANAINLALFNPQNIQELAILIGATTLGSTICDLDVVTSDSHKYFDILVLTISVIVLISMLLEINLKLGIIAWFTNHASIFLLLISFLLFILLCFFGIHQPHRSFMHSLLGLTLLTFLCYLSLNETAIYFFIGMITHILLDLLNKKGVQLFYPLKNRLCLKLCRSDGKTNNVLFFLSIIIIIYELFTHNYL